VDLVTHWAWLWLALALLGLAELRSWPQRLGLAALLLAMPWFALDAPLPKTEDGQGLRVLSANVNLRQIDPSPLVRWALAQRVELIALVELNPAYAAHLDRLQVLPYRYWAARDDPFGLGLASRWPLSDVRLTTNGGGIPSLRAVVAHPSGPFEVVVVHPMPPLSPQWHAQRNADFSALRPGGLMPALLAGDLNASPWSSAAQALARAGWQRASNLQPTWPWRAFGIPIDAVWAHGPWTLRQTGVGPDIGSDHLPVWAEIRLASAGKSPL
jgi:endonuclease/exonuclease/phosphatase (EEP) superfamily protein YafD